jgi:hypothetical protein
LVKKRASRVPHGYLMVTSWLGQGFRRTTSGLPQGYRRVKSGFKKYQNGMLHCGVFLSQTLGNRKMTKSANQMRYISTIFDINSIAKKE